LVKKLVDAIKNLVIGLFTTGKHLGRHAVTLQYPTQRWEMPERSRGIVVLLSDKETGRLNCNACMLCARNCPSGAITVDFEKDEKNKRVLKEFVVDYNVCCFCGLCEDSCNFAAIKLAPKYEFSTLNRDDLVWHKDKLQEMGRDVPYEKPVRKKPAARPAGAPPPKPAKEEEAALQPSEKELDEAGAGEESADIRDVESVPTNQPASEQEKAGGEEKPEAKVSDNPPEINREEEDKSSEGMS
jgi:NADH-quinone oxidoreductase subunit I